MLVAITVNDAPHYVEDNTIVDISPYDPDDVDEGSDILLRNSDGSEESYEQASLLNMHVIAAALTALRGEEAADKALHKSGILLPRSVGTDGPAATPGRILDLTGDDKPILIETYFDAENRKIVKRESKLDIVAYKPGMLGSRIRSSSPKVA